METVRNRALEALRLSTHPLDDDQLSLRLDIHPRQTINQATQKLASEGLLRRLSGPDGKQVNALADDAAVSAPVVVELATGHSLPPGESTESGAPDP